MRVIAVLCNSLAFRTSSGVKKVAICRKIVLASVRKVATIAGSKGEHMPRFIAWYENAEKAKVAARAKGWTENESLLDFIDGDDSRYHTTREFTSLNNAVDWLRVEVAAVKSMYGVGSVREIQPPRKRCSACTCRGWQAVHEWIVSDTGIDQDDALDSECYWEC